MPNGSKLWRLKYSYAGKEKRLAFGAYPTVPLQLARRRRDEARQQLAEGIDPGELKKADKQAQKVEALTFEALAREWHQYRTPRWAPSTAAKALAYLESDLLPALGKKPFESVTRPDLVALIRKIESRGAHNIAKKTRQWPNQIFRYGLARGVIEHNPATDLDVIAALPPPTKHHPHVTFAELPELLGKVETAKTHTLTRGAIQLLVLTAVRPGELRAAPWAEFDLDAATWTIPAARMKARRAHVVPLPLQALTILRQLHEITGKYPLVFAGRHDTSRPMSENTVNLALQAIGYKDRQTGHGFRHLLSTELNGRGYNRDWIERQLAHGDQDEIRDTYNHAVYLEQRREMMQAWADSIDALRAGGNVVSIKRKA
ncbi:putative integrase; KpLE2 phage-like element [Pseudomonas sp. 8BK]|nr:putative integrase; KpLE2 phage-like element [Pseudomonas sp. 8BK]